MHHTTWIDLSALWKIIVIGLLAGAGLPALFAIGLRALALPGRTPRAAGDERMVGGSVPGLVVAVACLAVILAAIGYGIDIVVSSS